MTNSFFTLATATSRMLVAYILQFLRIVCNTASQVSFGLNISFNVHLHFVVHIDFVVEFNNSEASPTSG